jgi:ribosome-associated toxin RatA of RatAB toxin-antitoxin module
MMQTETATMMRGPLARIVELAADVERWPEILPHYRWVTLLEGGGDRKVVEMAARRGRFPLRWHAIQEIDRSGPIPVIAYHHIWGPTRGMEVAWTFTETPEGVYVAINHRFHPPWPVIGNLVTNHIIGPRFIEHIAGLTLSTIKQIVEREHQAMSAGKISRS